MKLVVLAHGRLRDDALGRARDDYKVRLARYVNVEEIEVKDCVALARRLPAQSTRVMLEVSGEALSSKQLASKLEGWGSRGKGIVCFVIGGADGIPESLSQAGHAHLSLSSLTLPHRLARVVLFEQLYRAMTILRHERYARED